MPQVGVPHALAVALNRHDVTVIAPPVDERGCQASSPKTSPYPSKPLLDVSIVDASDADPSSAEEGHRAGG
jgi:hypothetical protein